MNEELKKRILSSVILVLSLIVIILMGSIIFNLFLLIIFCIIVYEWKRICKTKKIFNIGIFFLIFSFYTIYSLYKFNNDHLNFIYVLIICISTDIGGYVFGKIFNGPKLSSISPNKTYSGVIGGYLFSIISVYILFQQSSLIFENKDILFFSYIMVILISTVSQLGDIYISYFKRLSKVKDTGNIIPGHGGLLDRVDGMIFAFPFSYITLIVNLNFFK
tara:strand:+ start:93 stop:746 length:654 start_codon:yes stop_codon:yes gene_type:complete